MGLLPEKDVLFWISLQNEILSKQHFKNTFRVEDARTHLGDKFPVSATQQFAFRISCLTLDLLLKTDNWRFWLQALHDSSLVLSHCALAAAGQWSIPGEHGFLHSSASVLAWVDSGKSSTVRCIRHTSVGALWHCHRYCAAMGCYLLNMYSVLTFLIFFPQDMFIVIFFII